MGQYYTWGDYQKDGITILRLLDILYEKGFTIIIDSTDKQVVQTVISDIVDIKEWAEENLEGVWASIISPKSPKDKLYVLFTIEEDAVAFKLRWL